MRLFFLLLWRQLTSPVQGPDDPCSGCLVLSSPSFRDHNIFFMGLPFIGSSSEAPSFSSSSSRLSSDRRSNKSFPKEPCEHVSVYERGYVPEHRPDCDPRLVWQEGFEEFLRFFVRTWNDHLGTSRLQLARCSISRCSGPLQHARSPGSEMRRRV